MQLASAPTDTRWLYNEDFLFSTHLYRLFLEMIKKTRRHFISSTHVQAALLWFFNLENDSFKNHNFYDSLTHNEENVTDAAPPACLVQDYITLAACPAPSHENTPCFMAALYHYEHLPQGYNLAS